MTAEPVIPPPQETPQVPIPQGNDDASVMARFRETQAKHAEPPPTSPSPTPEPAKATPDAKASEGTDIPAEFFDAPKGEEDEFDALLKQEPKGHIKNENFKKLQEAASRKMEKLQKELEETKAKIPQGDFVPEKVSAQIKKMEEEIQKREELISRKYVEETPQFQEKFTLKKERILGRLEKAAKDLELPNRVVKSLLGTDSVKEREEILNEVGLGQVSTASITNILNDFDMVETERSEFLSDYKARQEELEAEALAQEDKHKAKTKEYYDRAFDTILEDVRKNNPLFEKKGNEAWDRQTEEIIERARARYNADSSTPQDDAAAFIAAGAVERANAMLKKATDLYRETKKELDELKSAGPNGGHGFEDGKTDPTKDMTPDQRAGHTFRHFQSQARNG